MPKTLFDKIWESHVVAQQPDSPALLRKIQDDPATEAFQVSKRQLKLVATIAASGAEDVSG